MRRVGTPKEVIDLAQPYEPRSTVLVCPVIDHGLRQRARAWIARLPDGKPAALLVLFRVCRARWFAASSPDDTTRLASLADLDELYRDYALELARTVPRHLNRVGSVAPPLAHAR